MYTAKIKSIEKQEAINTVQIVAVYTNSDTNAEVEKLINMPYGFTEVMLKEALRTHVKTLETTDTEIAKIVLNTPIDLSLSPQDLDKIKLDETLAEIDRVEKMVTLGVLTKAEATTKLGTKKTEAKQLASKLE